MKHFPAVIGQSGVQSPLIRIWLVEDDPYYQRAITRLVFDDASIELSRTYSSCEPAIAALDTESAPDVILLDIGLPGMSGIEGAKIFKTNAPETQIVMLTVHEDENNIFEAICAGASGYLLKHSPVERIIEAIHEVVRGGVPFTAPIARKVLRIFAEGPSARDEYGLSEREKEVLEHLTRGSIQKEIAEELSLSRHTIEAHLRHIYAKLHVRNGIEAVSKAIREHII